MIRIYCDSCGADTTGERGTNSQIATLHLNDGVDALMQVTLQQTFSAHAADLCNACSESLRDTAICRWGAEQVEKKVAV